MFDVAPILAAYLEEFPEEIHRQKQFSDFLKQCEPIEFCNRKNPTGHITASALIVNPANDVILLVHHKALKKWLQPGGHIELGDSSLFAAGLREAGEETGIDISALRPVSRHIRFDVPLDIDAHAIPARPDLGEGPHYHFDFRYLFIYHGEQSPQLNQAEVSDYKWARFAELQDEPSLNGINTKLWHALSFEFRTKQFYDAIIDVTKSTYHDAHAVVVCHMIPDCVYYLKALNSILPIDFIVPKPKSIHAPTLRLVEKEFTVIPTTRDTLRHSDNELVRKATAGQSDLVLFDIGGYFSEVHKTWPNGVLRRIKAIIEDTENGHQKYELGNSYPYRRISVARSPLKENEDFLVGQSVLFSADSILRHGGVLIQYLKCAVFGYGKVGKSIAFHLLQRGVKPSVFDIDPVRQLESFNRLCAIPTREEILTGCDVIFCATGNKCLREDDFGKLKHGCLVFSVTSSDDEMEMGTLDRYQKSKVKDHLYKYVGRDNFFYLANDGNAVNFLHNACMGTFIHLVRAEMLAALGEGWQAFEEGEPIVEVSGDTRKRIASSWIEVFDPEHRNISAIEAIL